MKEYYDRRADEYDETSYGDFGPEGTREIREIERAIAALPEATTLDVGCGTGYLTRHLRGPIVGLDQSERMLRIARVRVPRGRFVRADVPPIPFADEAFDRVFASAFYGHLEEEPRRQFLLEARRVGGELVVVDQALREGLAPKGWEERPLLDGSRYLVYKRYFAADDLLTEIGGGDVLFEGLWFVAVAVRFG
jgi:ubiquinone/menaquinone biosynthesis C-methylase UbiE